LRQQRWLPVPSVNPTEKPAFGDTITPSRLRQNRAALQKVLFSSKEPKESQALHFHYPQSKLAFKRHKIVIPVQQCVTLSQAKRSNPATNGLSDGESPSLSISDSSPQPPRLMATGRMSTLLVSRAILNTST